MSLSLRLIASDLDGTLLGTDREVRPANVVAANLAIDAGLLFVASTGRGHRSAHERLEPLPRVRWAVCSNGAVLFDREREVIEDLHGVPGPAAGELVERLYQQIDGVALAWETPAGFVSNEAWLAIRPPEAARELTIRTEPTDAELGELVKILITAPGRSEDDMLGLVRGFVQDGLTLTSSGIDFVEITGPGVDKAFGLSRLCARLGIDRTEVMAFGDQRNDIAMLEWAGIGVAMGNAHPETLEAADRTTVTNDEDGVAAVLEEFVC